MDAWLAIRSPMPTNPCLACGACCAAFRVSFYWGETDAAIAGGVPAERTEKVSPFYAAMKGTNQPKPRCEALEGQVGCATSCAIHSLRPSPCRAFEASYFDGTTQNPRCDEARVRHGMVPLTPEDWRGPGVASEGARAYDPHHE